MKMMTTKPLRYNNRSMATGTEFAARPTDVRVLVGIGKARVLDEAQAADELELVRAEYADVVGKKPFHGWDVETLKSKIAEAKED
ncbi:hypothetical protein [Falsirhodobacter xinxiangensis]|uniref:hypothetical protein n=1 Tax=Falsirhodobacter xinxiangensis TaxID=2530049 RepID=UPI0010A9C91A|nr:hypothetical protein [Rhodobacter xinxiangensis]